MGKDGPEVKDETIDDTLKDLAVYAVIVKVLREEAEGKAKEPSIRVRTNKYKDDEAAAAMGFQHGFTLDGAACFNREDDK
jgi:hypothetical protein